MLSPASQEDHYFSHATFRPDRPSIELSHDRRHGSSDAGNHGSLLFTRGYAVYLSCDFAAAGGDTCVARVIRLVFYNGIERSIFSVRALPLGSFSWMRSVPEAVALAPASLCPLMMNGGNGMPVPDGISAPAAVNRLAP